MKRFETRDALQAHLDSIRAQGQSIGLVPTMGNLHEGHLALVEAAQNDSDYVLATIFVNPLQFGPGEDLDSYPRTLEEDCSQLEAHHCDAVFIPSAEEMYPGGLDNQALVTVPGLSERHCGASRPLHFGGVCTVVCKLFNLTNPDIAFFGEKDYQQLQVIRKMTQDLCIPVSITGVPTVRLPSGLALSSRNNYLDASQLETAAILQATLKEAAGKLQQGSQEFDRIEDSAKTRLTESSFLPDYFSICHAATLDPATTADKSLVILAAAWLGETRLIDNIMITLS